MKALKKKATIVELLILFVVAALSIFYKFNQIPSNLAYDEVELAKLALSLAGKPYTPYSTLADGHGTPYFYLLLGFFKLFGVTSFALRLPAALFGIMIPILVYLILRLVFNKKETAWIGFFATLFLITSRWYFNFVRFAFEMPFLLFLELISVYAFLRFQQVKQIAFLFFTAFFAGVAFNSYQPGRIFFMLPLIFLLKEKNVKNIVSFLGVFAIVVLPITFYLTTHKGNDIRFNQQFFLKNTELTPYKKAVFMTDNIVKTALMFNIRGDVSGRHNYPNKPALNPLVGMLFIVGLLLALRGFRQFYNQFFLIYFILALVPALLTYPWENPNMLRTFTSLIPITYFIALSLLQLFSFLKTKIKPNRAILVLVCMVFFSALYDLRTYFIFQAPIFKNAFERENDLKRNIDADQRNQSARPSR